LDSADYYKLKDPGRSLDFSLKVLETLPTYGYDSIRCEAFILTANSEKMASHREISLQYSKKAIELARSLHDDGILMTAYFMNASIYRFYDEIDSALTYYQLVIPLYKPGMDVYYPSNSYTGMGGIFSIMGDKSKSETYLLKGYELGKDTKTTFVFTIAKLISFYSKEGNPKYVSYLDTFYSSKFSLDFSEKAVVAHMEMFLNISGTDEAAKEKKLREVFLITKQQSVPTHQVVFGLMLYRSLAAQNKFNEAEKLLNELFTIAQQSGNGRKLADVQHAAYETAKAQGKPDQALAYFERYHFINDSLHTEDMQAQINELNVKFEVSQKDHELDRQKLLLLQGKRSRNLLMTILGLLIVLALTTYFFFRNKALTTQQIAEQEKIIHQQETERMKKEKEVAALQASLNSQENERNRIAKDLHDGVGSQMSGISSQIEYVKSLPEVTHHISRQLDHLRNQLKDVSTELRRTSYELMPAILLKHGLEPAIRDLCVNLLVKNGIKVEIEINTDLTSLDHEQKLGLYRILQELLNNIVKHAKASQVLVQCNQYDGEMTLMVEDDGKGFDVTSVSKNGLGLGSLQARVNLLNGSMDIASVLNEGTTTTINFKLPEIS
jgi:signal transduction histidine kinase